MSARTHSVVVRPDQWSGGTGELARLVAPITGDDVAPLEAAFLRGPTTVDVDLTESDALRLVAQLSRVGVPASIDPPVQDEPVPAIGNGARRSSTLIGLNPAANAKGPTDSDGDGWGAVFPDLAASPSNAVAEADSEPKTLGGLPSADDLAADEWPDDLEPDAPQTLSGLPSLEDLEDEDVAFAAPRLKLATDTNPGGHPAAPAQPVALEAPAPTPAAEIPARREAIKPDGFDANKLAALLPQDVGERPPYAPTGYDPRPEHHPPFATMFAVLAPGAGHVFNGDDEDGLAIGLRFWMIKPWITSVKQATGRAEKIRDYWAPRPEDGSGIRAFRYVFAWWLCVAIITSILAWGIPTAMDVVQRKPAEELMTPERIAESLEGASVAVLGARVAGLDAYTSASEDLVAERRFTLTEEQRAERLFAIAHQECRRRSYAICEAMMRRVLELRPAYGPAIKLQAWASVNRTTRDRVPIPDIGEVPTLDDIELAKVREELVLDGENVPPPRKPEPNEPAADAGTTTQDMP